MKSFAYFSFFASLYFISAFSASYCAVIFSVSAVVYSAINLNFLNFRSTSLDAPVFYVKTIFHPFTLFEVSYLWVIKYLSTRGEYLKHSYCL